MGYSLDHVEAGQENHAAEYTCAVCCALVEAPLLTTCHHIFCTACLQDWFNTKPSCPTCSRELDPRHGAGDLRLASPLAWRVLGRLRVHCPVSGCGWLGEYSELTDHLTSSSTHQGGSSDFTAAATSGEGAPSVEESRVQQAEALKTAANSKHEARLFKDALTLYTKAINIAPEGHPNLPKYYLNRAATHLMSGAHDKCVSDCRTALQLDPQLTKAHKRLAKALCEMGEYAQAVMQLEDACSAEGPRAELKGDLEAAQELDAWQKEGEAAFQNANYSLARTFFANILQKTSAVPTQLWMVRAELSLGLCDRALRITREIIRGNENLTEPYVLRSLALMLTGDLDQAQKHLRAALRLNPDDIEAQREIKRVRRLERRMDEAKKASFGREFAEAAQAYTDALQAAAAPQHAPLSAALYADRAAAFLRLKDFDAALHDCARALRARDDCKAAWLTRASALHGLGRHEEALADMRPLLERGFANDTQINGACQKAEFEVRKAKRPDYFALLQVPSIASTLEIKAAYKQRALECHPDKMTDGSEAAKTEAEAKFKLLGEALEILTDDIKRKLYSEGYDRAAIEERVKAADRAAHETPHHHHHHHH